MYTSYMCHVRAIVMFLGYFPMISLIDPKTRPKNGQRFFVRLFEEPFLWL